MARCTGDRQHRPEAVRPRECDEEKHRRRRRSWRKLHITVDANTGEIVACVLAHNGADDAGEVSALLEQIESEIASVVMDGACDGEPVYQAITDYQPDPQPDVVIRPRVSAVPGTADAEAQSKRDRHIRLIAEKGCMVWQKATGYGRRSLAETTVGRFKGIIGSKPRARILPGQQGEAAMAAEVFTRMIQAAKPISIRIA